MKSKSKQAFSLIELSIVILIIGIIIAGVTQSSKLLNKSSLITAQTLTKSSPVAGIQDLILWLEPTLPESFGSSSLPDDSSAVVSWNDLNPQTSFKNNAQQSSADNQPLFISQCINGLPCVRFDGVQDATGDLLISDADIGSALGSTAFIVLQKIGEYNSDEFLFGNTLGYIGVAIDGGGFFIYNNVYSNLNGGLPCMLCGSNYSFAGNNAPSIASFVLKEEVGFHIGIYINGYDYGQASPTLGFRSDPQYKLAIANNSADAVSGGFGGNIAELIIFNRALKNEERQAVEDYLGKKWQIKITR